MEKPEQEEWCTYYKEALHRVKEIVLFYNASGKLVNWNMKASELGYDGEELIERTLEDLLREQAKELLQAREMEETMEQMAVYRKNGTCFLATVHNFLVLEEEVFGICTIEDTEEAIHAKKQLEEKRQQVKEAMNVKNLFMANITHELRTPLNGIKGASLLLKSSELTEEQKESLSLLDRCAGNMEHLINELLLFAKAEAGKMELEPETFYFPGWFNEVVHLHKVEAASKGLRFEVVCTSEIPTYLYGDDGRLATVIHNLLGNAVKFTSTGSIRVEVSTIRETSESLWLYMAVEDTGIGIEKEKQDRLFVSFMQVDPSITRRYGGTGLGLAMSKQIIKQMGGRIGAESTFGKGSRFYVEVPLRISKEGSQRKEQKDLISEAAITTVMEPDTIGELIEKLEFCMEQEAFEKAEQYAHQIKVQTEKEKPLASKQAFRLELSLRKQDKKKSRALYETLRQLVK